MSLHWTVRTARGAAGAIALVAALAGCRASDGAPRATPASSAAPATARLALAWPRGQTRVYALNWGVDQRLTLSAGEGGGQGLRTGAALRGDLEVSRAGDRDGRAVVRLRLARVTDGRMALGDGNESAKVGLTDFEGATGLVEVDPDGRFVAISVDPARHPLVQHALLVLAAELEVSAPQRDVAAGTTWTAQARTPAGAARVDYEVTSIAPVRLARKRREYVELARFAPKHRSDGTVDLEADGTVGAIRGEETMRFEGKGPGAELSSKLSLVLRDRRATPEEPVDWDHLKRVSMDEGLFKPNPKGELAQRVGDMTPERAIADLRGVGADGRAPAPDHDRWLWQVSGILENDASFAAKLEAAFRDELCTDGARSLVLDLLASVADAPAQAALRRILADRAFERSPKHPFWVQRLSFVEKPEPATRALALAIVDDGRKRGAWAIEGPGAAALGAVVGHSLADPAAKAFVDAAMTRLVAGLDRATRTEQRDAYVQALGNSRHERAVEPVVARASDPDPSVRSAVVRACAQLAGHPAAREAAVKMVTDGDDQVARDALGVLQQAGLRPADVAAIRAAIEHGKVATGAFGAVMNLVASRAGDPDVRAILERIRADGKDAATQARAQTLLNRGALASATP